MNLFQDEETTRRINVFDWHQEFPDIFTQGGFDVVIGNPPYIRIQGLQEHHNDQLEYIMKNFDSAVKRFDIYLLFIEKGFKLLKTDGKLGYICPHKFINSDFGSGLREFLINNYALEFFISFGDNLVFEKATTYTGILICSKKSNKEFRYFEFKKLPSNELSNSLISLDKKQFSNYHFSELTMKPWMLTSSKILEVLNKIKQQYTLGDIFDYIFQGVVTGIDAIYFLKKLSDSNEDIIEVFSPKEGENILIEKEILKPMLKGEDVSRYKKSEYKYYSIYPYKLIDDKTVILEENELSNRFPLAYGYLKKYKNELRELRIKFKTNPKYWYSCHRSRSMILFETQRIITPEISLGCNMTLSEAGIYHNTKVYSLITSKFRKEDIKYWLGLMNSKILWWFISNTGYVLRGGYYTFKTNYLKPFPIRIIDFDNNSDKRYHNRIVKVVDQMLDVQKKYHNAKTENEKTIYKKQIDILDNQIDKLVYKLYGLTEEEVRIVEGEVIGD
jgi:hypothetical protein